MADRAVIALVSLGIVPSEVLATAREAVTRRLGFGCLETEPKDLPEAAFDPSRGQYSSRSLLGELGQICPGGAFRVLGITAADLFLPVLTFVFGEAQLGGRAAVASTFRLREEFYLRLPDPDLLLARLRKEVVHELGHTLGLLHCSESRCVMRPSTTVGDTDSKPESFCLRCQLLSHVALAFMVSSS